MGKTTLGRHEHFEAQFQGPLQFIGAVIVRGHRIDIAGHSSHPGGSGPAQSPQEITVTFVAQYMKDAQIKILN
jgi:hypothetical protein